MGLFRRKEKEYTLGQILNLMQKDTEGKYHDHIPVPTRPRSKNTTYWFRKEERDEKDGQQVRVTNPILETNQESSSVFEQRRDRFMSEVNGNGEYRKLSHDIHESSSSRKGRVVPSYNNWQSAKKYNQGNQYGQYR